MLTLVSLELKTIFISTCKRGEHFFLEEFNKCHQTSLDVCAIFQKYVESYVSVSVI